MFVQGKREREKERERETFLFLSFVPAYGFSVGRQVRLNFKPPSPKF
jgi:hypothetical protein